MIFRTYWEISGIFELIDIVIEKVIDLSPTHTFLLTHVRTSSLKIETLFEEEKNVNFTDSATRSMTRCHLLSDDELFIYV